MRGARTARSAARESCHGQIPLPKKAALTEKEYM
jgi:hypothetical protein